MNSVAILLLGVHLLDLGASSLQEHFDTRTFAKEYHEHPLPEQCAEILNSFAEYASNFTRCSILHARPIRLCEKCIDHYMQFHTKYKELLDTVVDGTTCKSIFISRDRLDAVLEYHNSILSVWNKGNCNACYDWSGTAPELLNKTKHFYKMFNETMECITSNLTPKDNNSDAVCQKCMQSYVQLDEFYKTLSKDGIGVDTVCYDIVDSMNATRSIWSKSLNCCKLRRTPEIVFLISTAVIALLPVLFYLTVRFCGPIQDPNAFSALKLCLCLCICLVKQSRVKQTVQRSFDGRIN